MNEYYIFVTPDNTIWGVGQTRKESVQDAIKNIDMYPDWNNNKPTKGKVLNASEDLACAIWDNGFDEGMWEFDSANNIARLTDYNKDYYSNIRNVKETILKYDKCKDN